MPSTALPTGNEPRLPSPLGGPHVLIEGSFRIEFLKPPEQLDASVLMKATYVGGHELMKLGKKHPQVRDVAGGEAAEAADSS